MKFGKAKILFFTLLLFHTYLNADDKISTVPLVNLEELKPSYEEVESDDLENEISQAYKIKEKDEKKSKSKNASINICHRNNVRRVLSRIIVSMQAIPVTS